MTIRTIYVLSGPAGVGKDTIAGIITEDGGLIRSFADPIKHLLYQVDPQTEKGPLQLLVDMMGWDAVKRSVPEVRGMLQRLGTEGGRYMDADAWLNTLIRRLVEIDNDPDGPTGPEGRLVAVPDARFENEVTGLKRRWPGKVVHIKVTSTVRGGLTGENANHPSETSMGDVSPDFTIDNSGTMQNLREAVNQIVADTTRP